MCSAFFFFFFFCNEQTGVSIDEEKSFSANRGDGLAHARVVSCNNRHDLFPFDIFIICGKHVHILSSANIAFQQNRVLETSTQMCDPT